jgi:endonuclease/exonuclease/phosphatase (EEP) superfamily protein YafD
MTPRALRRHADRLVGTVAWGAVGVGGTIALSQLSRWRGTRLLVSAQALTPYVAPSLAPVALWATRRARPRLAAGAAAVAATCLVLVAPVLRSRAGPAPALRSRGVRVAAVNLLYTNGRTAEIASELSRRDLDVIVFTECTEMHLEVMSAHALADRYRHRLDRPGPRAKGVAVWSRLELSGHRELATVNHSIDVTVDGPDGPFRLIGVHTPTPLYDLDEWIADLATIRDAAAQGSAPTLLIGDFNATYWHRGFRRLLEAGFVDAHVASGRGLATSWPVGAITPPFAQLDHALTARGVVATDVENFDIPGSDHRAVAVTVRPALRATP